MDEEPEALRELREELAKTAVISDVFKDRLYSLALRILEDKDLQLPNEYRMMLDEYLDRRFPGDLCVRLGARSMRELAEGQGGGSDALKHMLQACISQFPGDAAAILLTGSWHDIMAFRDWLWQGAADGRIRGEHH